MRGRMRGLSVALALLALVGLGGIAGRGVFAQVATPTPPTASGGTAVTPAAGTEAAERNDFLDAFAAALGVTDQTQIDAAIQTAIDQVLADRVAAGELTQEQADAIKARVANGDLHGFGFGFGGPRGGHGHDPNDRADRPGKGDEDSDNDDANGTAPTTQATPAAGVSTELA